VRALALALALVLALAPGWAPARVLARAPRDLEGLWSEKDPEPELRLTGQYLEYDQERGVAVLKDGAFVEYQGLKIWSDNLQGDLRKSQFYASGDVTFWKGDERYFAESLSYNTKTHRGAARNIKTQRGPAIIRAKTAVMEPYRILGWDVSTTTDAREKPGYRIQARKMIMVPRKRIVFKQADFKLGERTLFTIPTYMINLKNPEQVSRFNLTPAWNPGKGFFVNATYDYYFTEWFWGRLYFNPSQYQGVDLGANATYSLGEVSPGRLDYYHYQPANIGQQFTRYDLRQGHTFNRTTDGNLNLLLTENDFASGGTERKLTVGSTVNRKFDDWTTSLSYDKLIDLDRDLAPGIDLVQYASSTPRLSFAKVRPTNLMGDGLVLRTDGSIARIKEKTLDPGPTGTTFSLSDITNRMARPREIDATKTELNLNFAARPLAIGDVSQVTLNFRDSQNVYSTGDLRNSFAFLVNTSERWHRNFSTAFDYVFANVAGNSPFATFDRLENDRHLLTGYVRTGAGRQFTGTLFQTQYDIFAERYKSASSNFVFRSAPAREATWALALTPIYQFNDPALFTSLFVDSIAGNLQLRKENKWSYSVIGNYDYRLQRLETVSGTTDFLLGPTLRLELTTNAAFNRNTGLFDFTKLNLGVTKDLKAFETRLRWNTLQKEIYLEFYLKFAAQKRLSVGVNYASDQLQFLNPDRVAAGFAN
jgi:hypothetical protein